MAQFRVTSIIDGDTFEVTPGWKWNGNTGSRVRPVGYDAPETTERGWLAAKDKLTSLLYGKSIELGEAYRVDRGRLVCKVLLNGVNLANYFPGY